MGMFILALAIAIGIAWVASAPQLPFSPFWEKAEFWQTWLATWLQGLGTVAAAYIGWRALSTWREAEGVRLRASLAEELLRAVYKTRDAYKNATVTWWVGEELTETSALGVLEEIKGKRAAVESTYTELLAIAAVAKLRLRLGLEWIGYVVVLQEFLAVENTIRLLMLQRAEGWVEAARGQFRLMGVRFSDDKPGDLDAILFDLAIDERVESVEQRILSQIGV